MLRFTTLGALDIVDGDGKALRAIVERPKRLALLAYLCLAGPGAFRSRDLVLATFWPELGPAQARGALNQALYVLRRELGRDVVVSRGAEQIGIALDRLWCDAVAFRTALGAGRFREALELYRGELLPGLYINDAPAFEHWLDAERADLQRRAAEAAWRLAEEEAERGDVVAAARWAVRSVDLTAGEETAVRRAIVFLDRIGDRAGALQVYETFAQRLAEEFDVLPSAETQQLIASVRAREALLSAPEAVAPTPRAAAADSIRTAAPAISHRLLDPDSEPATAASAPVATAGASTVPAAGSRRGWPRAAWWAPAVLIASLLAWLGTRPSAEADESEGEPQRLRLVIPPFQEFRDGRDSGDLAAALTSALISLLTEIKAIEVVPSDAPVPVAPPARQMTAGGDRRLSVILNGTVLRAEDSVRVTVVAVNERTGATMSRITVAHPLGAMPSLVDNLAAQLASHLRVELGRQLTLHQWRITAGRPQAWEFLQRAEASRLRAQELRAAGAVDAALAYLHQADSLFALAANEAPNWTQPILQRARIAEDRMWIALLSGREDRSSAVEFARRGLAQADRVLARESSNASALELRGVFSYWIWLLSPVRGDSTERYLQQAESSLRTAIALNPASAEAWSMLSTLLSIRGVYGEANWAAEQAYAADAYLRDAMAILVRLFTTSYEIGDNAAAERWCGEIQRRFPDAWIAADCRIRLLAWMVEPGPDVPGQAWEILRDATARSAVDARTRARLELLVANVLAKNGLTDSAEAVIQRARSHVPEDPDLAPIEAAARVLMGQPDSAIALLVRFSAAAPVGSRGILRSRQFAALREDTTYRRIAGYALPSSPTPRPDGP